MLFIVAIRPENKLDTEKNVVGKLTISPKLLSLFLGSFLVQSGGTGGKGS